MRGLYRQVLALVLASLLGSSALAEELSARWKRSEDRVVAGAPVTVFVEIEKTPGRPAFMIETVLEASPQLAALTLMRDMLRETDLPRGHEREILERGDREALVYTFIDLPFMLADRELALRIIHSDDHATGTHRIDWKEENDALPAATKEAVRLSGTWGYWEFRPDGEQRTRATYLTQTELGGSFPHAIADRLMKSQALDAVARLRGHLQSRQHSGVAAGLPTRDE